MLQRSILGVVFFQVVVVVSVAYAGSVELTSFYPAAYGEYKTLNTTETSGFATSAGSNIGIGTATPTDIAATTTECDVHITGAIVQEAWQGVTFVNSWVNYGAGWSPAGYYRDKHGVVHLRGLVRSGTVTTTIFTLPAGYRPAYQELFGVFTASGLPGDRVDVDTAGNVVMINGNNGYVSLDNISFRATGY